ncbi:MAG: hypothetical protein QMD22_07305 [archaeon]|nr:hypothetical protein [archaeon]
MNRAFDELFNFLKIHPIYSLIVTSIILALMINVASDLLSQLYGAYNAMMIVTIALVALVFPILIYSWAESRSRERLKAVIQSFDALKKKYKGLIVSISKTNETKEKVIKMIDSVEGLEDVEGLNKLYALRGIGQTFRAIVHHFGELKVCWLLYTVTPQVNP